MTNSLEPMDEYTRGTIELLETILRDTDAEKLQAYLEYVRHVFQLSEVSININLLGP